MPPSPVDLRERHTLTHGPVMLNAKTGEWSPQPGQLNPTLGDSGAFVDVLCARDVKRLAKKGTMRPNTLTVATANGPCTPMYMCDALHPIRTRGGGKRSLELNGAIIMDTCDHNLVSLGRQAELMT